MAAKITNLFTLLILGGVFIIAMIPGLTAFPEADEAIHLLHAKLIAEGQTPYQDFFQFITPGSLYIGALIFKLFGPAVFLARLAVAGSILAMTAMTLIMARPYLSKNFRCLLGLFFITTVFYNYASFIHHVFSNLFGLAAVFIIVLALRKQQARWFPVSGVLTACALFCTQSRGILLALVLGIWFLLYFRFGCNTQTQTSWFQALKQMVSRFLLPLGGMLLLLLLPLGLQDAWPDMLSDTVFWLSDGHYNDTTVHTYFVNGFESIVNMALHLNAERQIGGVLWIGLPLAFQVFLLGWLPVLGLLWGGEVVLRTFSSNPDPRRWEYLLLVSAASIFLFSTLSYSMFLTVAISGWLGYLLAACALQQLTRRFPPRLKQTLAIMTLLLLGCFPCYRVVSWYQSLKDHSARVPSYGTVESSFIDSSSVHSANNRREVLAFIRNHSKPGDKIFLYNTAAALYFLADRPMATRYALVYPIYTSRQQQQEIGRTLKNILPKIVIDDGQQALMFEHDPRFIRYKEQKLELTEIVWLLERRYTRHRINDSYTGYLLNGSSI